MAEANDLDASASQNPNQDVANRLKDGKTIKRDPFVTAREEMMTRIDEQVLAAREESDESFFQSADPRALAMAAEMGRESGAKRFQLTGKDASQKRRQSRQSRKESRLRRMTEGEIR